MTALKLVSVFDSASESYTAPTTMNSRGAALRSFMDIVSDEKSVWAKHPEHYSLFLLGDFDPVTGKITPLATPDLIANAWQLNE